MQDISKKVDTSISGLGAQMPKLQSRLEALAERSTGSNSSSASPTSRAGRNAVPSHSVREGGSNVWVPKTIFIRGWAPFGCPTSQKISREEATSLELRIRQLVGSQDVFLGRIPLYVCNH